VPNDEISFRGQALSATHRISDYHLGAGVSFANGVPNLLEDFKGDEDYVRMLQKFLDRFGPTTNLTLEWGGDMVDFNAIPYLDNCGSVPTVEAALAKIEACIQGHPAFWTATRCFLADKRHALAITIGNHDLEFVWPEVQKRIRMELNVPQDNPQLQFVTEVLEGDTCKLHGDAFDPPNANPAFEDLFIFDKFRGQPRKLLNVPYSDVLNASFIMSLKRRNPWIGRMENHGAVWIAGLTREWRFGFRAIAVWIAFALYHRFFIRFRNIRRQASLTAMLQLALNTLHEDRPEPKIRDLAQQRPEVRFVESGHTHVAKVVNIDVDGRPVTWLNTGTGIEQIRLTWPTFSHFITPWPEFESFFRRIGLYWQRRPLRALGLTLIHVAAGSALFVANWAFGWSLDETAWIIAIITLFSWLMRQSYAFHTAESYTEYNVLETILTENGRVGPRLIRYHQETGAYGPFVA
jgi:hypothetical protein